MVTPREGVGAHRVQGPYTTSLALSEYMALTMPFVLHFCAHRYHLIIRVLAAASVPILIFSVLISQSRLGLIGIGLSFLTYLLFWAIRRRLRHRNDLMPPAIILAY